MSNRDKTFFSSVFVAIYHPLRSMSKIGWRQRSKVKIAMESYELNEYTLLQKKRNFSGPIFPGDPWSMTLTPGHLHFVKWFLTCKKHCWDIPHGSLAILTCLSTCDFRLMTKQLQSHTLAKKSWKDEENTFSQGCSMKCLWNWTGESF